MRIWLNRQLAFLDYAIAAALRHTGRNLAVLAVYALVVFVMASALLFSQALRRETETVLAAGPDILVQHLTAGRPDPVDRNDMETIRRLRGIAGVTGRLWGTLADPAVGAPYTIMAEPDHSLPAGGARIGEAVARARGLREGDTLAFRAADGILVSFTVHDILPAATALAAADLFVVGEDDFRRFFAFPPDRVSDIAVHVANPQEVATVVAKIAQALPADQVVARGDILRVTETVFDQRQGLLLLVLGGGVLAFVILACDQASGLSAEERREIALLKAVGWETADIMRLKGIEGGLVSCLAVAFGYIAAYLHVFHAGAFLLMPVMRGWSVLSPALSLRPDIDSLQILTVVFITVFPFTLATLVPGWRAASIEPAEGMR
jgi:hypothetical protein